MIITLRTTAWGLMALLAVLVALVSVRYFALTPQMYFLQQRDIYVAHPVALLAHIGGGVVALLLGPWQLRSGGRRERAGRHRWMGRVYLSAVTVGGIGGLFLAPWAYGGTVTSLGFATLAALWLITGWQAYSHIIRGRVAQHRRWMIRNYALTFAAVSLRVMLPLLIVVGLPFQTAYIGVAWACWLVNLLAVEVYFRYYDKHPAGSARSGP